MRVVTSERSFYFLITHDRHLSSNVVTEQLETEASCQASGQVYSGFDPLAGLDWLLYLPSIWTSVFGL